MAKLTDRESVVKRWILYANDDEKLYFGTIKADLGLAFAFTNNHHAQQAIEKWLKALLILNKIQPPKTHDLVRLCSMLKEFYPELNNDVWESRFVELTKFAVNTKYPDLEIDANGNLFEDEEEEEVDQVLIEEALQATKAFVYKHLPFEMPN